MQSSKRFLPFDDMDEVREAVVAMDGVLTVSMGDIRDAFGKDRLGKHVRDAISKRLAGLGVGHYPEELPIYQEAVVRLYTLGSPVADLIEAVQNPSDHHDEILRRAVGDEAAILEQIRELVCQ